jgi:hypothetical protein
MDWKAIIVGFISTVIVGLFCQLVFILMAAYIGGAGDGWDFLANNKEVLWFASALLTYCLVMLVGGLITASIARTSRVLNATTVGVLAGLFSLWASMTNNQILPAAIVLVSAGVVVAGLGGKLYNRWFA